MTPEVKDYLKTKLVETCLHLNKTKADKKESLAAFSEEIKGAEKRVNLLSEAVNSEGMEGLAHEYGVEYVEELEKQANKDLSQELDADIPITATAH